MYISAMLPSLPMEFEPGILEIRKLGFSHVDVAALSERPAAHIEALADSGLIVSCAAIGRSLPEAWSLDSADLSLRQSAVGEMKKHIIDASKLGARFAYIVPELDGNLAGLRRLAESCAVLSEYADSRKVQLCIEHFPRRALSSVKDTLEFLERFHLDKLKLLLDVGHCLISEEDPAHSIAKAGDRLGYVHFDDNDSTEDLHWPLLSGRLTKDMIDAVINVLAGSDYNGGVALELNPKNDDPVGGLRDGKRILDELLN